jgi:hypothetical protein
MSLKIAIVGALVEGGDDDGTGFLGGGDVRLAHAALGSDDGNLERHVCLE